MYRHEVGGAIHLRRRDAAEVTRFAGEHTAVELEVVPLEGPPRAVAVSEGHVGLCLGVDTVAGLAHRLVERFAVGEGFTHTDRRPPVGVGDAAELVDGDLAKVDDVVDGGARRRRLTRHRADVLVDIRFDKVVGGTVGVVDELLDGVAGGGLSHLVGAAELEP